MVVILALVTAATGVEHERIAAPSASTVQAPHCAMPQPYFVPVSISSSRSTHKSGVDGSDCTATGRPLMLSVVAMRASLEAAAILTLFRRRAKDRRSWRRRLGSVHHAPP